ncbi:hypothetical protein HZB69_04850 [Candidatus Amesbacteria bacterium]|nr:hypothetical protein [Candidatus Amesbacteria bacterium]
MSFKVNKIHHIELTVRNAGDFYLGLTTHSKPNGEFDETVTGLDHVSFEVDFRQDLDSAIDFFDKNSIKHGETKELSNNLWVLAFRDPDNIQLELCYKKS